MTTHTHRTVRTGMTSDLSFIVALQRTWANSVGFLPRQTLERYLDQGQALVVIQDAQHAGYLTWTLTPKGLLRVIQVAVEPDLLRTTIGTKILRHLERAARRGSCSVIRLQSRADLPCNLFWPELGFTMTGMYQRPTKRSLPLYEWTNQLHEAKVWADALHNLTTPGRRKKHPPPPQVIFNHTNETA